MTDSLQTALKAAAPIADETVARLTLDAETELLRAIMAEPRVTTPPLQRAPRVRRAMWERRRLLVVAAAACAILLAGVSLTRTGTVETGPARAWAAEALRVAGAVPRVMLDVSGWHIARADELAVRQGELTFTDGGAGTLDLQWLPRDAYRAQIAGSSVGAARVREAVDVLGTRAVVLRTKDLTGYYTAVWRLDGYTFALRNSMAPLTQADFVRLLRSLTRVSVDEWLGAMPPITVLPSARDDAVRNMLSGIPLPSGFDAPALDAHGLVRDRYQLGAQVAGAVACAWIGQWVDARGADDRGRERAALAAMESSRSWPVLRQMNATGDYPEVVWGLADAMAGRRPVAAGKDGVTVAESYRATLGCDGG